MISVLLHKRPSLQHVDYITAVWPDVGIKSSPIFTKYATLQLHIRQYNVTWVWVLIILTVFQIHDFVYIYFLCYWILPLSVKSVPGPQKNKAITKFNHQYNTRHYRPRFEAAKQIYTYRVKNIQTSSIWKLVTKEMSSVSLRAVWLC